MNELAKIDIQGAAEYIEIDDSFFFVNTVTQQQGKNFLDAIKKRTGCKEIYELAKYDNKTRLKLEY